jgi:hypothetical protein
MVPRNGSGRPEAAAYLGASRLAPRRHRYFFFAAFFFATFFAGAFFTAFFFAAMCYLPDSWSTTNDARLKTKAD